MPHSLSDHAALGTEYVSLADELRDVNVISSPEGDRSLRAEAAALLREARTLLQILHVPVWHGTEDPILGIGSELLANLVARCFGFTRQDGTWAIGTVIDLLESEDPMPERQIFQAADALDDVALLFHDLMLRASGDLRRRCWAVHRQSTSLHQKKQTIGSGAIFVECDVCHTRAHEISARRKGWLVSEEKDLCPEHRPGGAVDEPIPEDPPRSPVLVTKGGGAWGSFVEAAMVAFTDGDSAAQFAESCVQALGEAARAELVETLSTTTETGPLTAENVSEPDYVRHALAAFRRASTDRDRWSQLRQRERLSMLGLWPVWDPANSEDQEMRAALQAEGIDLDAEFDIAEGLALGELLPSEKQAVVPGKIRQWYIATIIDLGRDMVGHSNDYIIAIWNTLFAESKSEVYELLTTNDVEAIWSERANEYPELLTDGLLQRLEEMKVLLKTSEKPE